jgi:hypothetical protein
MISNIAPPQIRATTGLELAAGLYTKCCSELASQLNISLTSGKSDSQRMPLRVGINGDAMGGMRAPIEIGQRRVDIAYINPSAIVAMAFRGKGYYKQKMELRVLACFPSWDRIAMVVSKDLGIKSLHDIARRKFRCAFPHDFRESITRLTIRSRPSSRFTGSRSIRSNAGAVTSRSARGRLPRRDYEPSHGAR